MPCEKCGTVLVSGLKYDSSKLWCPKCEGFELISKDEASKENVSDIKFTVGERDKIISRNSRKSLIESLGAALESISFAGTILSKQTDFLTISSICYGIKKIMSIKSDKFGSNPATTVEIRELVSLFIEEFRDMYIIRSLIKDDYIVGIRIQSNKLLEYAVTTDKISVIDSGEENIVTLFKFTEDWNFNRLVALRYGIHSKISILDDFSSLTPPIGDFEGKFKEFQILSRIYYGFQFSFGSSKMLNDLKNNTDLIEIIYKLHTHFFEVFKPRLDLGEVIGSLTPIDKETFLDALLNLTDSPENIYRRLLKLSMPLVNEIEGECFVLPHTLKIYYYLLCCKEYFDEIKTIRDLNGAAFEKIVYNCIRLCGYEVINPVTKEPLLNFKIFDENDLENGKPKRFEIDVAGFKEDVSILIECKHLEIGDDFFRRDSINKRKKDLLEHLKKFQHNIDLIRKDKDYEFLTNNKSIYAYMVTLNPEPIEKYEDIRVVSFEKFELPLYPNKYEYTNISIGNPIYAKRSMDSHRTFYGVDWTKTITNSYGLNPIYFPAENSFKSSILVGDGVVKSIDEKKIEIINLNGTHVKVNLTLEDIPYLKSKKIQSKSKVRYQIYTRHPLFFISKLRFIRKM